LPVSPMATWSEADRAAFVQGLEQHGRSPDLIAAQQVLTARERERERESVCVCVCERERERESK
jgi:hypothetical protein